MKFDSIKSRLLLMTLVCVIGMTMLVGSQHLFTQRLVVVHQQRDLLLRLGQDLLQLRRHEKDFLLRHQMDYYHRFNQRAGQFQLRLSQLKPLFESYNLSAEYSANLAQSMQNYQSLFNQLVKQQTKLGLTPNQGLLGSLAGIEQQLVEQVNATNQIAPLHSLTQARLATRDFLLTRKPFFENQFTESLNALKQQSGYIQSTALQTRVAAYEHTFAQLSRAVSKMGETHNQGLRGQFRAQAHQMEANLKSIDDALQPLIQQQERQVRIYSISIALLTSIVLILLLIKSFATFHKAFSNFVMFFYRCKRQYQRIDTRQLGFAEFKSLAELANEMVESRRDMEQRLACANARLARERDPSLSGSSD